MSTGSLLDGSGRYPNASRIAATTFTISGSIGLSGSGFGPGLRTQRITNKPIMHMIKSASVKIHSGHSSHSTSVHLQSALDMGGEVRGQRSEEATNGVLVTSSALTSEL